MAQEKRIGFVFFALHGMFSMIMFCIAVLLAGFCKIVEVFAKFGWLGEKIAARAFAEEQESREITVEYIYLKIREDLDKWNHTP